MSKLNFRSKIRLLESAVKSKSERMYEQMYLLLHNYVFSGVVVATKKHTIKDADTKEGLRINRSAFTGDIVLHTGRKYVNEPLHVSQEILRFQELKIAKYKTIEEFEPEFLMRLERGENIKINWVYPGTISDEMQRILDVYSSYCENNPLGKGKVCFSHEQKSFNLLDSKSALSYVANIFKDVDVSDLNFKEGLFPSIIKSSIEYLSACGYTGSEIIEILKLAKDLLPECKDCKPRNLTDFVVSILNEYISKGGFLSNTDKFVSKVNHTAGGLGVIEWNKQILSELIADVCNFDENLDLSEEAVKKISQNFLDFMRYKFNSPRLTSESDIEDFIVNNGVAFQEYLACEHDVKVEKSINFIQVKHSSSELSSWEFLPVIMSDQIIVDGIHIGNIIQLHDQSCLSMKEMFSGTNMESRVHFIGAAYSTLVYLILSITPCEITNTFLVNTLSDFNSIPILYSGIDLMEKLTSTGLREVKMVEINPRFTGCIQALARVMQEATKRNTSIYEITKENNIVSATFYFDFRKIYRDMLDSESSREILAKKIFSYLQEKLNEMEIMLISFQMSLNSSRISYCYLIDASVSKNEVSEDLHRQQEIIFNFMP
jgi:hypothetical protein